MGRLTGKVVVVTGGGQGIGFSIARSCAREGAALYLTGRDGSKLERAAGELRSFGATAEFQAGTAGVRADAQSAIRNAVERLGRVDVLVNNAHTQLVGVALEETSDEFIKANIESGLYGTIHHMQAAFPHMKDGGGSIINIGSLAGIGGTPGMSAYAATKEAIRGVSRVAAREWGRYNIRVNVLCPVALTSTAAAYIAKHSVDAEPRPNTLPLGRMGDPDEDIAPVALFLASDDSRFVTGQTINADGGQVML